MCEIESLKSKPEKEQGVLLLAILVTSCDKQGLLQSTVTGSCLG